jgi:hypothetical protein
MTSSSRSVSAEALGRAMDTTYSLGLPIVAINGMPDSATHIWFFRFGFIDFRSASQLTKRFFV